MLGLLAFSFQVTSIALHIRWYKVVNHGMLRPEQPPPPQETLGTRLRQVMICKL